MTLTTVLCISLATLMVTSSTSMDPITSSIKEISSLNLQSASDIANGPFSESAFKVLAQNFLEVVQALRNLPLDHIQSKLFVLSSGIRDHQDFNLLEEHHVASRQLQNAAAKEGWVKDQIAAYNVTIRAYIGEVQTNLTTLINQVNTNLTLKINNNFNSQNIRITNNTLQIDELYSRVGELNFWRELYGRLINENRYTSDGINQRVDQLFESTGLLNADLAIVKTDVAHLQSTAIITTSNLNVVQLSVTDNTAAITANRNSITSLQTGLAAVQQSIANGNNQGSSGSNALEARVVTLEGLVQTIQTDTTYPLSLVSLKARLTTNEVTVNGNSLNINAHRIRLEQIEGDSIDFRNELDVHDASITDLTTDVTDLKADVIDLQLADITLTSSIAGVRTTANNNVAEINLLKGRVTPLETASNTHTNQIADIISGATSVPSGSGSGSGSNPALEGREIGRAHV